MIHKNGNGMASLKSWRKILIGQQLWGYELNRNFQVQSNLDYPDLDYPDYSIIQTFFLVPIISWMLIACDCCQQPNNPFKRLSKQCIIPYAFQNSQVQRDKELFRWVQLIYDCSIVLLPREFHAWLLPSMWVITRVIDHKLKPKTCLWNKSELFNRFKISR